MRKDSPRKCVLLYDIAFPLHYHVFGLIFCAALGFGIGAVTLRSPWPVVALIWKEHNQIRNKIIIYRYIYIMETDWCNPIPVTSGLSQRKSILNGVTLKNK